MDSGTPHHSGTELICSDQVDSNNLKVQASKHKSDFANVDIPRCSHLYVNAYLFHLFTFIYPFNKGAVIINQYRGGRNSEIPAH